MKKIFVSLLAVMCLSAIFSQRATAQFRYGPIVGLDITNLKFKQNLIPIDRTMGFTAGVLGEMMFPGIGFGMDIGMYYQMLGANLHMGDKEMWASQGYGTERCFLHTLVVPLHLKFKYTRLNGFEEKLAPLAFVGPSFNFTVAHSKNEAMSYPGGNLCLDFGLGAEIFEKWQVTASYSLGMTYCMSAKILTNQSARNRSWNLRVTYFF